MERNELESYIKKEQCIPGGTKEACIKVREALNSNFECVTLEEFMEAAKTLATFAAQQSDREVVTYGCDPDCVYAPNSRCKGKMLAGVDKTNMYSANMCPYYIMEDK